MTTPRRVIQEESRTSEGANWYQNQLDHTSMDGNEDMIVSIKIHTDELHDIWDKLFVHPDERSHILEQLRSQCIDLYIQRLDYENERAFKLISSIAKSEDEIDRLCLELDEAKISIPKEVLSLQSKLDFMTSTLEKLRKEESKRWLEFNEVCIVNLSLGHLRKIYSLCEVLDKDFVAAIFQRSCNDQHEGCTLEDLEETERQLTETKKERLQKLQRMQNKILDLWEMMEMTICEQHRYRDVMKNLNASLDEVVEYQSLSTDLLKKAETELMRLENLRLHKIKDIISGKRTALEKVERVIENVKAWELDNKRGFLRMS
uniref:Uncharacterized protein n=1 Tax=Oryza punctata TaxID=4537 RepID=A0A0E0KK60_ORYPU